MELDESTVKLLSFEKGRILIATSIPHKIIVKIQLEVNHQKFVVDIIEEDWDRSSQMLHRFDDDLSAGFKDSKANGKIFPQPDSISHNARMEGFFNLRRECKEHVIGKHDSKEGTMMDNKFVGSSDSFVLESDLVLDLVPFNGPTHIEVGFNLSESQSNTRDFNGICSQINLR